MSERTVTFVELLYPGIFLSEEEEHEVAERKPKQIAEKYPNAFCFQFYDQVVKEIEVDGMKRLVRGPRRNTSAKYYPGGKTFTADQLRKADAKEYRILISNMECNGWKKVVKCRTGNFQPLEADCRLIA